MMPDDDDSESEHPTAAAKAVADKAAADKAKDSARNKRLITGAAIGIGSAALVAALLYARRRSDRT